MFCVLSGITRAGCAVVHLGRPRGEGILCAGGKNMWGPDTIKNILAFYPIPPSGEEEGPWERLPDQSNLPERV